MTHINAYIQEVEDKRIVLLHAQAAYDKAVRELEDKQAETGESVAEEIEAETEPEAVPEAVPEEQTNAKKVKYR